jgi:hypothetical protein
MKSNYTNIILLIGFALSCLGCQESKSVGVSNGSAGVLNGPYQMADYIRKEPAVKNVQIWKDPNTPGLIIQTQHYRVHTTLLDPLMLQRVPSFLESAYKAYQSQLPSPLSSTYLFDIYLFGTRSEWEEFTRSFVGDEAELYLKLKKGAYTANGAWVGYNIGRKLTFQILGHEGWHQFNQRLFMYRLPSWLDEGIATLFETCRYHQGQFLFEPGRNLMRLGSLKRTIQRRQLIPLRQLIVLNPGQVLSDHGSDDAVVAFYAQNYALVRFLREYRYGIYLRKYHLLLLGGAEGSWPLPGELASLAADRTRPLTVGWNTQISPILFAHYIEPDIDQLEKAYREFCGKIVYHVRLK